MAVNTTGSLVRGLVDAMSHYAYASGTKPLIPAFHVVVGDPDGLLTSTTGSDLAYDIAAGGVYIGDLTNGAGGNAWTAL